MQVDPAETEIILDLAKKSLVQEGDLVELGCYRGDTSLLLARLIEKSETQKRLFIYDSFEGLPEKTEQDQSAAGESFQAGRLKATKAEVINRFKKAGLTVPIVKKGFFEELTNQDLPEKICFGFLDGDLYRSIQTSLKLTADRLVVDGVLVIHDYNNPELPGVSRAIREFLENRGSNFKLEQRISLAILRKY